MLGAVVGSIIGSLYRYYVKSVDFPLFTKESCFNGDTVMTLAVARAVMNCMKHHGEIPDEIGFKISMFESIRRLARRFSEAGYSKDFAGWLFTKDPHPYRNYSNDTAIRVSPISWAFDDLETVEHFAELSASVTHRTFDGVQGAVSTAGAVFLARTKQGKEKIREYLTSRGCDLSRTLDEMMNDHASSYSVTLIRAFTAFLEGNSFEDIVRKALSFGGNPEAACIAASLAEPCYGIPTLTQVEAFARLPPDLQCIEEKWEQWRD